MPEHQITTTSGTAFVCEMVHNLERCDEMKIRLVRGVARSPHPPTRSVALDLSAAIAAAARAKPSHSSVADLHRADHPAVAVPITLMPPIAGRRGRSVHIDRCVVDWAACGNGTAHYRAAKQSGCNTYTHAIMAFACGVTVASDPAVAATATKAATVFFISFTPRGGARPRRV